MGIFLERIKNYLDNTSLNPVSVQDVENTIQYFQNIDFTDDSNTTIFEGTNEIDKNQFIEALAKVKEVDPSDEELQANASILFDIYNLDGNDTLTVEELADFNETRHNTNGIEINNYTVWKSLPSGEYNLEEKLQELYEEEAAATTNTTDSTTDTTTGITTTKSADGKQTGIENQELQKAYNSIYDTVLTSEISVTDAINNYMTCYNGSIDKDKMQRMLEAEFTVYPEENEGQILSFYNSAISNSNGNAEEVTREEAISMAKENYPNLDWENPTITPSNYREQVIDKEAVSELEQSASTDTEDIVNPQENNYDKRFSDAEEELIQKEVNNGKSREQAISDLKREGKIGQEYCSSDNQTDYTDEQLENYNYIMDLIYDEDIPYESIEKKINDSKDMLGDNLTTNLQERLDSLKKKSIADTEQPVEVTIPPSTDESTTPEPIQDGSTSDNYNEETPESIPEKTEEPAFSGEASASAEEAIQPAEESAQPPESIEESNEESQDNTQTIIEPDGVSLAEAPQKSLTNEELNNFSDFSLDNIKQYSNEDIVKIFSTHSFYENIPEDVNKEQYTETVMNAAILEAQNGNEDAFNLIFKELDKNISPYETPDYDILEGIFNACENIVDSNPKFLNTFFTQYCLKDNYAYNIYNYESKTNFLEQYFTNLPKYNNLIKYTPLREDAVSNISTLLQEGNITLQTLNLMNLNSHDIYKLICYNGSIENLKNNIMNKYSEDDVNKIIDIALGGLIDEIINNNNNTDAKLLLCDFVYKNKDTKYMELYKAKINSLDENSWQKFQNSGTNEIYYNEYKAYLPNQREENTAINNTQENETIDYDSLTTLMESGDDVSYILKNVDDDILNNIMCKIYEKNSKSITELYNQGQIATEVYNRFMSILIDNALEEASNPNSQDSKYYTEFLAKELDASVKNDKNSYEILGKTIITVRDKFPDEEQRKEVFDFIGSGISSVTYGNRNSMQDLINNSELDKDTKNVFLCALGDADAQNKLSDSLKSVCSGWGRNEKLLELLFDENIIEDNVLKELINNAGHSDLTDSLTNEYWNYKEHYIDRINEIMDSANE